MKIAVMGAGAMGCVFGAALANAGFDTTVVDVRTEVIDAINASGITVQRDGQQRRVKIAATTDPTTVGPVDLILFLTKSYHTDDAASFARSMVGSQTTVATMQNGVGNGDILANSFEPAQVVLGVTAESGTILGPGVVDHPGRAATFVGPYDGGTLDRAQGLADVLSASGFDVEPTPAIETEIWRKLVVGASTLPAPALLGLTCGELMNHDEMRGLMDETAVEVVRVARALGHNIDEGERILYIHDLLMQVPEAKGSMVQDIEVGRRTEIDFINGAVVRAGSSIGVETPVNRTLVALVKGWESRLERLETATSS
jgi:2-dehydropantoate 2-reductase